VTFVKLGVQGDELLTLAGAGGTLDRIAGLQAAVSLMRLPESAPMGADIVGWAHDAGISRVGLEPGFADPWTRQILQVVGIFFRG
jgi:catalase (peroxidase I)